MYSRFFRSGFNWVTGSGLRIQIRIQAGHNVNQKLSYCRGLPTVSYYGTSLYVINISEWNVNKSANRLYIYAPKLEWYGTTFSSYSFAGVNTQYTHYTSPTSFILQQYFMLWEPKRPLEGFKKTNVTVFDQKNALIAHYFKILHKNLVWIWI